MLIVKRDILSDWVKRAASGPRLIGSVLRLRDSTGDALFIQRLHCDARKCPGMRLSSLIKGAHAGVADQREVGIETVREPLDLQRVPTKHLFRNSRKSGVRNQWSLTHTNGKSSSRVSSKLIWQLVRLLRRSTRNAPSGAGVSFLPEARNQFSFGRARQKAPLLLRSSTRGEKLLLPPQQGGMFRRILEWR